MKNVLQFILKYQVIKSTSSAVDVRSQMEFLGVVGTPHKKERSDSDPIWLPVQSN
jgi:hypothetical protein